MRQNPTVFHNGWIFVQIPYNYAIVRTDFLQIQLIEVSIILFIIIMFLTCRFLNIRLDISLFCLSLIFNVNTTDVIVHNVRQQ